MKRNLTIIAILIALATIILWVASSPVHATTSTLSGTILDAQGNPLNGSLTMQLPVPAQDTASNTAIMNTIVRYKVVNGVIQSGPPLYDVAGLQPTNLYYITKVYDSANNLVMSGNYAVTGGTFNLGTATPTSITTSNISFLNPASLSGNNTWTGTNAFTQQLTESVPTGTPPFSVASTTLVPNLNVQNLNGVTVSGAAAAGQILKATSSTAAQWAASFSGVFTVYSTTSTTGSTSIGATTIATASVIGDTYQVSFYLTQIGAGVGCTGTTSILVGLNWTDPNAAAPLASPEAVGTWVTATNNGSANTPLFGASAAFINQGYTIQSKANTVVQFNTTYTGGAGCTVLPTYQITPVVIQLV